MTVLIRFATADDADALVRLRAEMFAAMGQEVGGAEAPWRRAARAWFAARLGGPDLIVTVAELPGVGPVASAMAVLESRAPSPTNSAGLAAHVSQVSTLPEHRRRGSARRCMASLLAALDARGIVRTDLFATTDGDALYRAAGFRDSPYPALRRP